MLDDILLFQARERHARHIYKLYMKAGSLAELRGSMAVPSDRRSCCLVRLALMVTAVGRDTMGWQRFGEAAVCQLVHHHADHEFAEAQ